MFKSKSKKIVTLALCGLMATGIMGTSIAQANFHNSPPAYQPYYRGPEHHRHHKDHDNNNQNIAGAVVVGAVIGAVIAKNT